jgi:hypothetical protein
MGGLTKTGNVDTKKDVDATMDKLSKGRVSNGQVLKLQDTMANNQLAKMIPMFEVLMNQGQQQFTSNPMFGGQMPQPPQFSFGPLPQPPAANMSPNNRTGGSLGNLQQVPGQPIYNGPTGGIGNRPMMTPEEIDFIRRGGKGMITGRR